MSFKVEVHTLARDGGDDWSSNAIRLDSAEAAERYGRELLSRWLVPDRFRVVEVNEPAGYTSDEDGRLVRLTQEVAPQ